uniref:Transthyretin-like family protein n=1 Tax=Steinernema glaseri TaxID=37863 RepID=A0A1I8A0H5_9BILA
MTKFLLLLALVSCLLTLGSPQITEVPIRSVGVQGTVLCGKQPAEGVKIRLFRTKADDLNEMLAYKTTGRDGSFVLEGNTVGRPVNETDLIPTVRFYHNCDEDPKKAV